MNKLKSRRATACRKRYGFSKERVLLLLRTGGKFSLKLHIFSIDVRTHSSIRGHINNLYPAVQAIFAIIIFLFLFFFLFLLLFFLYCSDKRYLARMNYHYYN